MAILCRTPYFLQDTHCYIHGLPGSWHTFQHSGVPPATPAWFPKHGIAPSVPPFCRGAFVTPSNTHCCMPYWITFACSLLLLHACGPMMVGGGKKEGGREEEEKEAARDTPALHTHGRQHRVCASSCMWRQQRYSNDINRRWYLFA